MNDYKYLAFISYSHLDSSIVQELQKRIEKFKLPLHIANEYNSGKRYIGENRLIYSTETSINIKNDLWPEVKTNIDASEFLIIICSENTPESDYSFQERKYFRVNHNKEKMICIFVGRDPEKSIPRDMWSIRPSKDTDGLNTVVASALPRYCNYKHSDKKMRKMEFELLIAKLLNCDYDVFADRIQEYHRKRVFTIILTIAFLCLTAMTYFAYSSFQIKRHYNQSLMNQAESKSLQSDEALAADDRIGAIRYALEALPYSNKDIPVTNHALLSLERAIGAYIIPETKPFAPSFTYNLEYNIFAYTAFTNAHTGHTYIGFADRLNNIEVWDSSDDKKVFADNIVSENLIDILFYDHYFFVLSNTKVHCYDIDKKALVWEKDGNFIGYKDSKKSITGGRYLVFDNYRNLYIGSYSGIIKFEIDNGDATFISLFSWNRYEISNVAVSPDGKKIAYTKSVNGSQELHLCDIGKKKDISYEKSLAGDFKILFAPNDEVIIGRYSSGIGGIQIISGQELIYTSDYEILCFDHELNKKWSDNINTVSGNPLYIFQIHYKNEKERDFLCIAAGNTIYIRDMASGLMKKAISLNGNIVAVDDNNNENKIIACTDNGELVLYDFESENCQSISSVNGGIENAILIDNKCYLMRKEKPTKVILYSERVFDASWREFEDTDIRQMTSSDHGIIPVDEGFLDTGFLDPTSITPSGSVITFYNTIEGKAKWSATFSENENVYFLGLSDNGTEALYFEKYTLNENNIETQKASIVSLNVKTGEAVYTPLPSDKKFNPEEAFVNILNQFSWKNNKLYFVYQNINTLRYYFVCYNTKPALWERPYRISDISQVVGSEDIDFSGLDVDETENYLSLKVTDSNLESTIFVFNLHSQCAYNVETESQDMIEWNIKNKEFYTFKQDIIYFYNCDKDILKDKELQVNGQILKMIYIRDSILVLTKNGGAVSLTKYNVESGNKIGELLIPMDDSLETYSYNWELSSNDKGILYLKFNDFFNTSYMMEIDIKSMEIISLIPNAISYNEKENCYFCCRNTGDYAYGHSVMDLGYYFKHNIDSMFEIGTKLLSPYDEVTQFAYKSNVYSSNSLEEIHINADSKKPAKKDSIIESVHLLQDVDLIASDMIPIPNDEQYYVQTSGYDNLVLKKDQTLWYFGQESDIPVQILDNVKDFCLKLDTDTYGANSPVALILCNDGTVYGCGDTACGTLGTDQNGNILATEKYISFLNPQKVAENIREIWIGYRYSLVLDEKGTLHLWTIDPFFYSIDRGNTSENNVSYSIDINGKSIYEYLFGENAKRYKNVNFIMSDSFQQDSYLSFYIAVMTDGSVWTCHLPDPDEEEYYSTAKMRMGDGTSILKEEPIKIFESGTCW